MSQGEATKKALLSTLIHMGKLIDHKTRYLKPFESLRGEELEAELYSFLRTCVLQQALSLEFTHDKLKIERQHTENLKQVLEEQRLMIERMKFSNFTLIKEIKDLKFLLKEVKNDLEHSNQNSEIIEKIQTVQGGMSAIENDFGSFLKNEELPSPSRTLAFSEMEGKRDRMSFAAGVGCFGLD